MAEYQEFAPENGRSLSRASNQFSRRNFSTADNITIDNSGVFDPSGEDPLSTATTERIIYKSIVHDANPKRQFASPASVAIIGYITFVGDSARGLVYPALWPLCEKLGGNKVDLGWLVAMFSIGRLVISTRLGMFADIYRHRLALSLSSIILVIGAGVWANAPSFGNFGLIALYSGQFIMGLGTGSLGVTRSYISEQTPKDQRTYQLARLSSLQYAGFAMTPLVGAALVVGGSQISDAGEYALPAYLVAFLGVLSIILLFYPFQDIKDDGEVIDMEAANRITLTQSLLLESQRNSDSLHDQNHTNSTVDGSDVHNPLLTYTAPSPPLTTRTLDTVDNENESKIGHDGVSNSNLTTVESSNGSLNGEADSKRDLVAEQHLLLLEERTAKEKNQIYLLMMFLNFTTRGAIAIYEAQSSQILLNAFGLNEISLGTVITCAGSAGTINFLFFKEFWTKNFSDMAMMQGGLLLMGLPQFLDIHFGNTEFYNLWRFLLPLFLMYSIGYPVGNSAILGSFSKLQRTNRQSKAQGQFAFMGSLARIVFPIISGYLEEYIEETSAFSLTLIIMALSLLLVTYYYWKILFYTADENTLSPVDKDTPLSLFQKFVIIVNSIVIILCIMVIFEVGPF